MSNQVGIDINGCAAAAYASVGLIANPFRPCAIGRRPEVSLPGHAAAMRLVREVAFGDDSADLPLWLERSAELPTAYQSFAVADLLAGSTDNQELSMLVAYVPFDCFRIGRVRGTLSVVADRLSGRTFGKTLGLYALEALLVIDHEILEAAALDLSFVGELIALCDQAPEFLAEQVFGPHVVARGKGDQAKNALKIEYHRQMQASADSEPDPDTLDEDVDEIRDLSEPSNDDGSEAGQETHETDEVEYRPIDAVRDYVIAHARRNLSPVVARALRVYFVHGAGAMSQELKVTRGPRKTLKALVRFAGCRFKRVVILYDQFDGWGAVPQDLRMKIVAGLTEIRWAVSPHAVVAIAASPTVTPELAETFAAARKVDWTMPEVQALVGAETLDEEALDSLLSACVLPGRSIATDILSGINEIKSSAPSPFVLDQFAKEAAAVVDRCAGIEPASE